MLRDGTPNVLTVHGLREVESCPPHFTKVPFSLNGNKKDYTDWIWENLEGRFWFDDLYYINDSGNMEMSACAAFEIPGEASMFALCLSQITADNYL
jgi:hypothetical protein